MVLHRATGDDHFQASQFVQLTFLMLSAVVDCGGGWLRSQAPWPSPRRTDGTLPRSASLSPRMPGPSRRPSRLVCLHHPRHPPTPPAPGAVCEARRGGRALHDGPAAVGRWCWRGQCTWCVCAGARRAVVVAVLRAAGVVALAPPSVVTASHPAAIATATPEEQCGNPPPVPCTGTSHQQPPMHRCALCLRLRARGAAG